MKELKESDLRELRRIQESIPDDLKRRLIIKRAATPTMAKMLSLALHRKDLTPEQREKFQTIKDSGILNKKEEVVNETIQKRIDKYLEKEINRSIAAGRLSPYAKETQG